jgi:hypothetical protein
LRALSWIVSLSRTRSSESRRHATAADEDEEDEDEEDEEDEDGGDDSAAEAGGEEEGAGREGSGVTPPKYRAMAASNERRDEILEDRPCRDRTRSACLMILPPR